jgi:4-amino-4-deoxy-L-arabinose transferase-like glycosyltransferase
MEMLFASSVAGALLAMALWLWHGRRRWLFTFYGLLALSVLAKGLAGIVLAALILAIYCLVTREWRWLLRVLNPWTLVLFAVIALPWYAAMTFKHGDVFIQDFIIKHHFRRFLTEELAHPGPWWFYVPVLLAGLFPWTAHLGALRPADLRHDNRRLFLLIWVAVTLVFFSASQSKLPGYVLPALPALALWIGEDWKRASRTRVRAISAAQGGLLLVLGLSGSLPEALSRGVGRATWSFSGTTAVSAGLLILALVWLAWRGRRFGAALLMALVPPGFLLWALTSLGPQVDRQASARPIAQAVCGRTFSLGDVRRHIRYGLQFYCDRRLPDGVNAEYVLSSREVEGAGAVQHFPEAGLTLWKR